MIHRLGDAYRSVVSSLSATSTESKFVQEGKLTPEEFIATGDQLVYKFPTWEWASGDPSRRASYLPEDKQYLITRQVPCKDRVKVLDRVLDQTTREVDGWLTFEGMASRPGSEAGDDLAPADGTDAAAGAAAAAAAAAADGIDDDCLADDNGLPDFGDLDAELADEGDAAAASTGAGYIVAAAPDETERIRTYDLSITYDKYYQVPRMWLFGYDEYSNPLKPNEVFEDVLKEYREKTVTVDPHPLTGTPTVSIHPCKHSLVMKKVVDGWLERGITPVVDHAIFVFLKFISGVVPTINYDFTVDMEF